MFLSITGGHIDDAKKLGSTLHIGREKRCAEAGKPYGCQYLCIPIREPEATDLLRGQRDHVLTAVEIYHVLVCNHFFFFLFLSLGGFGTDFQDTSMLTIVPAGTISLPTLSWLTMSFPMSRLVCLSSR